MKRTITLLDEKQLVGTNKLDVLKKYGIVCAATDAAILSGAIMEGCFVKNDTSLKGRTCSYYTKSPDASGDVLSVNSFGELYGTFRYLDDIAIRPVISFSSSTKNLFKNRIDGDVVEYGEFPQYVSSNQDLLEKNYNSKNLNITGRMYTIDDIVYQEYYFGDSKYVRVVSLQKFSNELLLSDGNKYNYGDSIWLKVEPVKWYVDDKTKSLVCVNGLLSGISFDNSLYNGKFENTSIKEYLDECLMKELFQVVKLKDTKKIEKVDNRKSYGFDFNNLSQEEMIKGCIESDVPVFLHGAIGDGKSARVKAIDPDLKIIYLRNISFEGLNGKSVYNSTTGEMIDVPPSWYKELKNKCLNEPNKLHILFFDELTNALPSIQGSAFNIILDREVNGIWKLPSNVRMVAAGNEVSDSLSANQLSAPLFSRFAHVYIKTDTLSWLKWASESNIHPAIYTFIAYKNGECLRSMYDGIKPNADPRKWEMASKVLYKMGNPNMLRSLIGDDITDEFIEFCYQKVITLEDVIKGKYNEDDIKNMDASEKYATILALTRVDVKNIDRVRKFISIMESEMLGIFDSLWAQNDEEKMEVIAEKRLAKRR